MNGAENSGGSAGITRLSRAMSEDNLIPSRQRRGSTSSSSSRIPVMSRSGSRSDLRAGSQPPTADSAATPRPPLAPKPSLTGKLSQKLSLPSAPSESGSLSGRSTPSGMIGSMSRIPRPEKGLKKWDSTSRLEMQRTSSDLDDRRRSSLGMNTGRSAAGMGGAALTRSMSVEPTQSVFSTPNRFGFVQGPGGILPAASTNLSRSTSNSVTSLNGGAGFSSRSVNGSRTVAGGMSTSYTGGNLSRASSAVAFSAAEFGSAARAHMAAGRQNDSKSPVASLIGGKKPSKSSKTDKGAEEIERLKKELLESHKLIQGLKTEVGQKEQIAKMAVSNGSQEKSQDYEVLYKNLQSANVTLTTSAKENEEKIQKLEAELKEARDNADLLEFRLLEMEQRDSRERTPEVERRESDTSSLISCLTDSGCASQTNLEDLVDMQRDFKSEKISDTKTKLHQLMEHIPEPGGKSLLLQTVALFETLLTKINVLKAENDSLQTEKSELQVNVSKMEADQAKLTSLEAELLKTNEELEETKQKARSAERKLNEAKLEAEKKETLNKQIHDRQTKVESDLRKEVDTLQARIDSDRKGQEAESRMYQDVLEKFSQQERKIKEQEAKIIELQDEQDHISARREGYHHNKVPSVLSDTSYNTVKTNGSSSGVSSDLSDSENDHNSDAEHYSPAKELMHKEQFIESGIFDEVCHGMIEAGTQTSLERMKTEGSQCTSPPHVSEYGSCEELDIIHNNRLEMMRRDELDQLSMRLKEMESKWEQLYSEHQQVVEEKCELEEAENDSRLRAQTLEIQYNGVMERSEMIKDELILERQHSDQLKLQMEDLMLRDERTQEDVEQLSAQVQEQESLIRELEETANFYSEQLRLLTMGVKISNWWRTWSWLVDPNHPTDQTANKPGMDKAEVKDAFQKQIHSFEHTEAEFKQREESLMASLESIEREFESFLDQLVSILFTNDSEQLTQNKREDVMKRVKSLVENQTVLKKQITDLEKKETAYTKTIKEADSIMARVELSYQQQVKMLEKEKIQLKDTISALEEKNKVQLKEEATEDKEAQEYLREEAKKAEESEAIEQLTEKLRFVEKSEQELKERIAVMEKCEADLRQRLEEREDSNAKMLCELKEKDDLVKKMNDIDTQNQDLAKEIERLKDVEDKLKELRESEANLKERLAELERNEENLSTSSDRDNDSGSVKSVDDLSNGSHRHVEGEASSTTVEMEASWSEAPSLSITMPATEASGEGEKEILKNKVNILRLQIRDLETEVSSKSAQLSRIEANYAAEVRNNDDLSATVDSNNNNTNSSNAVKHSASCPLAVAGTAKLTGRVSVSGDGHHAGGFYRYKSMRDHNGRFLLRVKIR